MAALTKRRLDAAKPAINDTFFGVRRRPVSEPEFILLERKCLLSKFASAERHAE